jgi:hypothetical protein
MPVPHIGQTLLLYLPGSGEGRGTARVVPAIVTVDLTADLGRRRFSGTLERAAEI